MKRISFSGTFTVSDKVFEYLQSAEHLAGVDQVGMYRTNDTFLYFIHDALEDWVNMNQKGLIKDSQNLCETLAETNKLLALLVGSRGVSSVPVTPSITPHETLNPLGMEEPKVPEPVIQEEPQSHPELEKEPDSEPAPRQVSPDEIRARLTGFIRK